MNPEEIIKKYAIGGKIVDVKVQYCNLVVYFEKDGKKYSIYAGIHDDIIFESGICNVDDEKLIAKKEDNIWGR